MPGLLLVICLVMILKDEEAVIERCLASAAPLIDSYVIVDTGSSDDTKKLIRKTLKRVPGEIIDREWDGFATSLNAALAAASIRGADWTLRLDADMTVEAHPDLKTWLAGDPDPGVAAWNVLIEDHGMRYRLPLLTMPGLGMEYRGATHEWFDTGGRRTRSLLGLTVTHHGDGANRDGKLERDLELLASGWAVGDPRSVFYTAECLRFLGRTEEAIEAYEQRASLGGFEEERWFATYQAARLRGSVDLLFAAWRQRPHRHEPLAAAAQLVGAQTHDDILFVESI